MNTHTPGPWNDDAGLGIVRADMLIVATASGPNETDAVSSIAQRDANARLIAAAPDLLEALRGMADEAYHGVKAQLWMTKARAAIAKAEGKA
jgi:hypothetical protein